MYCKLMFFLKYFNYYFNKIHNKYLKVKYVWTRYKSHNFQSVYINVCQNLALILIL